MDETTISLDKIEIEIETREKPVRGITLPYRDVNHYTNEVRREGEVFIEVDDLYALLDQGEWDSQLGKVLLLGYLEGLALEAVGLAVRETRGGYHGTEALDTFMKERGL